MTPLWHKNYLILLSLRHLVFDDVLESGTNKRIWTAVNLKFGHSLCICACVEEKWNPKRTINN